MLVVSKKHPLADATELPIRQLHGLACALPSTGFSTRRLLDKHFSKEKISPKILLEINDIPALLTLVERGSMGTLVSRRAVEGRPELSVISITGAAFCERHVFSSIRAFTSVPRRARLWNWLSLISPRKSLRVSRSILWISDGWRWPISQAPARYFPAHFQR